MKNVRIDYTVYPPDFVRGEGPCWDFRTLNRAKAAARSLGAGARIDRNFNKDKLLDWWSYKNYWIWDGRSFLKRPGGDVNLTAFRSN